MPETLVTILSLALLALGFGFVVFWHELGHFLAAKAVGIKVEQFAVGFGHAVLCWRKGIGLRVGTTAPEYRQLIRQHLVQTGEISSEQDRFTDAQERAAAQTLRLGETEYRLNWMPLGGYVKMLGQDDMNPNATSDDPRAFNRKSVGARMIVISAGVIMNVILAAVGFTVLFLIGFTTPPSIVGAVSPGSPAERAGLQLGDRIVSINGADTYDFNKITLNTALARAGQPLDLVYLRNGETQSVQITPIRQGTDSRSLPMLGIHQLPRLSVPESYKIEVDDQRAAEAGVPVIRPGEAIVSVGDVAINAEDDDMVSDYRVLMEAISASAGRPVPITIRGVDGNLRNESVEAEFLQPFGSTPTALMLNFAGIQPRAMVGGVSDDSAAKGKLLIGDVITALTVGTDETAMPTATEIVALINRAGRSKQPVTLTVLRGGETVTIEPLEITKSIPSGDARQFVLGFNPVVPKDDLVVAEVLEGSLADRLGLSTGDRLTRLAGQDVRSWHEVYGALRSFTGTTLSAQWVSAQGDPRSAEVAVTPEQLTEAVRGTGLAPRINLPAYTVARQTNNPLQAAAWGVYETRDFILQGYITLQRVFSGQISYKLLVGPVGIFHMGTIIAPRGIDWLIWFLAMISVNLAVVNFLPIPIVDGGHFVFLLLEKFTGKPLGPRAQSIAQIVGLALIIGVFLLTTYQDVTRLFTGL